MSQDNAVTCQMVGCKNPASRKVHPYLNKGTYFQVCDDCYEKFKPSWKRDGVS